MKNILLLEDNVLDADLVSREIKTQWPAINLTVVKRLAEARKLFKNDTVFDVAIFDLKLPDGNGMDLLCELREQNFKTPIIIYTGDGTEEIATIALKAGANDYISKKPGFHKQIADQIKFTVNQTLKSQKHLKVLYIEHHKSDIDLTNHYLKKYAPHIHITPISSGDVALEMLPSNNNLPLNYDVVLLDYKLSGLNGLEIIKIIRQERKLIIPIVIVTGQGDESIAVEALKVGADDYVVKHKNYLLHLPSVLMSAFQKRELERQQLALKQSETKFRLLADYTSDWEYWVNPEKEYIYNSPVCEQTSGYTHEDFVKNKNLLTEIALPKFQNSIAKHFLADENSQHEHKPLEFKIKTAKGEIKWIQHKCRAVFDDDNNYVGKRGVNRDITAHKDDEEQILQALEKAKESDRLKSAFLANMSHEIRTPMNGILGFSQLLKRPNLSVEDQKKYIGIIEKSSNRMLSTINDIMDISKIEAGQMTVSVKEFNINTKAEDLFSFFKPEATKKGIELLFKNKLEPSEAIIKSDENKVYSILLNLIKNAIKFTMQGSVEFGYSTKENNLEFFVKDTGIGIPKDRQAFIFDRFVQADIEDKAAFEGSGLGLTIAKSYVEMLNGEIWVTSEIEKGSEFYFKLPLTVNNL